MSPSSASPRKSAWTTRKLLHAGSYQVAARVTSLATSLFALWVGLSIFDAAEFGVWVTLSSVTTLLFLFDLGFGSGIVSQLAEARSNADRDRERELVAASVTLLTASAAVMAAIGLVVATAADSARILGVEGGSLAGPARDALVVTILCAAANLCLAVSVRVLLALGYVRWAGIWPTVGSLAQGLGLAGCIAFRPSLVVFTLVYAATPLIGLLCAAVQVARLLSLAPANLISHVHRNIMRLVIRKSSAFFLIAVAATVGYQTDVIVIANVLGPAAAGRFGLASRVMLLGPMLITLALQPLWPATASWRAEGRARTIQSVWHRSTAAALGACILWVALVPLWLEPLLEAVTDTRVNITAGVFAALGILAIAQAVSGPLAFVLNGLSILRIQVVLGIAMAAVNIVLSIVGVHVVGIAGPAWATVLTQTTIILVPLWFIARHRLRTLTGTPRATEPQAGSRNSLAQSNTR